ncbi:uncharacterized protein LOC118756028 [Rhagoletis pomonella]|uniref:uncharacterized protein LOC118756028 n=1 Tax=Rhagoletis pomonella TaxID=28610 RepID=UPI00177D18B1|nr:uncharacterized protein LOC118756028 [Rhagoletis pomonella]
MLSRTKLLLVLLLAVATTTQAAIITSLSTSKISPEMINELKDFLDLIPAAIVDEIVAKHYIIDSNFREVLNYLRSTQFTELMQQAEQIPEVAEILAYLHLLVPDAEADAVTSNQGGATYGTVNARSSDVQLQLESQLDFVLLNELNEEEDEVKKSKQGDAEAMHLSYVALASHSVPPPYAHHLRTFSSFVEELLKHLPRDQYVQLINQKRQQNLAFAQFYAALRSAELRPMVDVALKSSNLTTIIKTLTSNGVDVQSLEATAFKVISWGPVPIAVSGFKRMRTLAFIWSTHLQY